MSKINLPLTAILSTPLYVEVDPGTADTHWHILGFGFGRLCKTPGNWDHRHSGMTAPVSFFCPRCLEVHAKNAASLGHRLSILGINPPGQYIVAAGPDWSSGKVEDTLLPLHSPLGLQRLAVPTFRQKLVETGHQYGYNLEWSPDYQPVPAKGLDDSLLTALPVILADRPDYLFPWPRLRALALERAAQALRLKPPQLASI